MTAPHSPRWAGLKDHISQREVRVSISSQGTATPTEDHTPTRRIIQSWRGWARQKIRSHGPDFVTVEEVHLVPGWATKRPPASMPHEPQNAFDVELQVSGFATSRRTPECLTRSQRAFLRIARRFASIPKPPPMLQSPGTDPQDYPELLHLPPRPDEIPDDYDVETLEAQFRDSGNHNHEVDDIQLTPQSIPADPIPTDLTRYENLVSRLRLFWASALPSRKIRLSVFLRSPDPQYHRHPSPFLTREILTGTDGHFSDSFTIDWNDICAHPAAKHITSNQTHAECDELLVEAQVINTGRSTELYDTPTNIIHIPMTHSIIHIISDIDDTVKISKVTDGARAIFNQVFVKDLEDSVIPEMGEWYDTMWKCGVSFHYVSNSPFELLPLLSQFISISNLPPGSIRLRSYAGRSLFGGLLSAPATRKRGNVVEVLDQFPEAQFLLVGDSGEQDLELYSSLAAERPNQIAGVFIRDVSAVGLEDPTGIVAESGLTNLPMKPKSRGTMPLPSSSPSPLMAKRAASDTDVTRAHQGAIRIPRTYKNLPPTSYSFEPSPDLKFLSGVSEESSSSIASASSSTSSSLYSHTYVRSSTEGERKRWDLQNRLNKARSVIPPHVMLRVFEDPKECVEAEHIIRRFLHVS